MRSSWQKYEGQGIHILNLRGISFHLAFPFPSNEALNKRQYVPRSKCALVHSPTSAPSVIRSSICAPSVLKSVPSLSTVPRLLSKNLNSKQSLPSLISVLCVFLAPLLKKTTPSRWFQLVSPPVMKIFLKKTVLSPTHSVERKASVDQGTFFEEITNFPAKTRRRLKDNEVWDWGSQFALNTVYLNLQGKILCSVIIPISAILD